MQDLHVPSLAGPAPVFAMQKVLLLVLFIQNCCQFVFGNLSNMKTYTLAEVEDHKVAKGDHKDVWIVLHDKVYDVSKFLDEVRYTVRCG